MSETVTPQAIEQRPHSDYARIATTTPEVAIGDVETNVSNLIEAFDQADAEQVDLLVTPELSITGYTAADLFHQDVLLDNAMTGLNILAEHTRGKDTAMLVGAPIAIDGNLYNTAVMLHDGEIRGIIPKSHLPNYNEFYEQRWFASGDGITGVEIDDGERSIPFGTDVLFEIGDAKIGIELCEDLWAPRQPSTEHALAGANIIANLSASNELISKAEFRRKLVGMQAARLILGYVYASSGVTESSADVVFSGHNIISENGRTLQESERFATEATMQIADIDLQQLRHDRTRNTTFRGDIDADYRRVVLRDSTQEPADLRRTIDSHPFVPSSKERLDERAEEILNIQAHGLASQMRAAGLENMVLGLSGGLDSTLALLVSLRAANILGLDASNVHTITMPSHASSDRTQDNAGVLAELLGTTHAEIPIADLSQTMLDAIGHGGEQDIAFENTQARMRTSILMNTANNVPRALVVGTGDLSEIALGWATFNGDHMSMYNVNASVPKQLVRHLVDWASNRAEFAAAHQVLQDIIDTPISPELTGSGEEIEQTTEDIVGPYELHEFFLSQIVRHGSSAEKTGYLALQAFDSKYSSDEIAQWLNEFVRRFTHNQFKRESAPNGPKTGSVSLSQRGDWRMTPSTSSNWARKFTT